MASVRLVVSSGEPAGIGPDLLLALAADPDLAALDGLGGTGPESGAPRAVTDWTTTGVLHSERIG